MNPKRFGMRNLSTGRPGDEEQQTVGGIARKVIDDGVNSGRDTLGILADKLQENEHPAAEPIRRLFYGEGEELNPEDYQANNEIHPYDSARIFSHANEARPQAPSNHIVLPNYDSESHGVIDPNTAVVHMTYMNHPRGHFFRIDFHNRNHTLGRRFLLPVSPKEVQNYAHGLQNADMRHIHQKGDEMLRALQLQPGEHEAVNPHTAEHMSRRGSLKKYATSTVARVMGHGDYANEMAPTTVGTRLSTVLREIKHGIGKNSPRLQQLTQHALGGSQKPELYTAIRDELFKTKDPRAVALAHQYNWHKVGEGLERDKYLRDFVVNSAKGTRHENHHQMFRRFYNGLVHGKEGPDENTRGLFYKALRKHLINQTGKDATHEQIEDSLRRLGETEDNHEKVNVGKIRGTTTGGSKFESPDYEHPAYTGTPKEGKFPPKKQISPIEKRAPGQYRRTKFGYKLT